MGMKKMEKNDDGDKIVIIGIKKKKNGISLQQQTT